MSCFPWMHPRAERARCPSSLRCCSANVHNYEGTRASRDHVYQTSNALLGFLSANFLPFLSPRLRCPFRSWLPSLGGEHPSNLQREIRFTVCTSHGFLETRKGDPSILDNLAPFKRCCSRFMGLQSYLYSSDLLLCTVWWLLFLLLPFLLFLLLISLLILFLLLIFLLR